MKKCKSVAELVQQYGEPGHKVLVDGLEIWHYPLGAESGMLYSVHVAVSPDQSSEIYMHFEPTDLPDTSVQSDWWRFWRRK